MLRVLIADDEERICQLILALGEWQRLGLEVVGTAQNGPDALAMLRSLRPDILITDIRMPGFDGLKVIEEARRELTQLEVIVISGYAQFDYAQTAIRFGVGEYLLKPINRDALNLTLEKMANRLRQQLKKETDIETLMESHADDRTQLRKRLVADLLAGRLEVSGADALRRTYHFDAHAAGYQILLLKIDFDPDHLSDASLHIVQEKVSSLLAPLLQATCADVVSDFADATLTCLMNYAPTRQEALRQQLRAVLNQLVAEKGLYGQLEFSMALGGMVSGPDRLAATLTGAQNLLAERLTEGTGQLLEGEAGRSGVTELDYPARYSTAASQAIDVMGQEEADAAAAILEQAAAAPGVRGWELLLLVRAAGAMFVTRLGAEDGDAAIRQFHQRCAQCADVPALFTCLRRLQRDQLAQASQRLKDRDAQPIRNAKLYIRKHFAEPITLEEVSAAIGFSVNYFSTLFKKETGEGFAKYLTHVRMDEARALLRDTHLAVAEICRSIGYGDLKHFTRTFKAETGLTPGEYRKLYG